MRKLAGVALRVSTRAAHTKLADPAAVCPVVRVDDSSLSESAVETAVQLLREGQVIALPTDTLYGVAADARNAEAVRRLYNVKGRAERKPLAICVGRVSQVKDWAQVPFSDDLLNALLPGPLTLLLRPSSERHLNLPGNPPLVGVRVPGLAFPCLVAERLGGPLALTSANLSGAPSALAVNEFQQLWSQLSAVFDGGVIVCEERFYGCGSE
ncbi:threonylcarbamoyl-AMP synthase [Neocloeon triangulifer]|uniref:threonylcarbamoyl-AMP synthase n=1 Tax=Neocloeon triangulifer TaxID=2078957 RepID=UPI00286F6C61|nr:threonylcarbamoyl-AMP synthase [Neocloeon triangulifer]